jgi:hypothetical protein
MGLLRTLMQTRTSTPSDRRDLLAASATVGMMLVVSASAKIGYGVWALGIAASTWIFCKAAKYLIARMSILVLRYATAVRSGGNANSGTAEVLPR